jgi:NhaP-type Na+/H+ and K+/H+ antiporter
LNCWRLFCTFLVVVVTLLGQGLTFGLVAARREVIDAQREELLRWRDAGQLPDSSLRVLERELDHEERTLPPHDGH